MTVSHTKGRPANAAYYLREARLRDMSTVGWRYSGGQGVPLAEWLICGPTDSLTAATLSIESRLWHSLPDKQAFRALAKGFVSRSRSDDLSLVQNAGSPERVAFHDFTLSAPKSVSVVWALADAPTRQLIEEAQRDASHAFVKLLGHQVAYSRQGPRGTIKTPCSLVAALFPHLISRSSDPQLHTHCVFLNVAVRPDGSTGCLETLGIMGQMGIAATLYHEVLANGMRQIGFSIQQRGRLFEIEGVPADVCRAFSQRRVAALAQLREGLVFLGGSSNLYQPSRRRMQAAVLKTRPQRPVYPIHMLRESWIARARELYFELAEMPNMNNVQQSESLRVLTLEPFFATVSDELLIQGGAEPDVRPYRQQIEH